MNNVVQRLAQAPDLRGMSAPDVSLVMAMRMALFSARLDRDPMPELSGRLGSHRAAMRFMKLIELMGHAWVDPLMVNRPCCTRMTPDEAMLLSLVRSAAACDQSIFDQEAREMLPDTMRDMLFAAAGALLAVHGRYRVQAAPEG